MRGARLHGLLSAERHKWKTAVINGDKYDEVKSNMHLRRGECSTGTMPLAVPVVASDMCEDCYEVEAVPDASLVPWRG